MSNFIAHVGLLVAALIWQSDMETFVAMKNNPSAVCSLSPSGESETCCESSQSGKRRCCTNSHLDNVYHCSHWLDRLPPRPQL